MSEGGRHTGAVERDDAEDLRRRLYAPGASADDVDRFREAEPAPRPVAVVAEPLLPPPPPRSRRRPVLLLGAVVVLAALVVVGITVGRVTTAAQDSVAAATPVRMSADDFQEIETNLSDGNGAGIAAFLVTHSAPPALVRVERADTFETHGTGDTVAQITPVMAETFQGHATVLIALERTGEAGWTLYRRRIDPTGEQQLVVQQQRRGVQEAGALTTDTFRYASGDRPVQVRVEAPAGVRWGLAVVLTN